MQILWFLLYTKDILGLRSKNEQQMRILVFIFWQLYPDVLNNLQPYNMAPFVANDTHF